MSGDLEDFLRRAAQRRQAKESQQQASQPPQRQRPQYSNRRTERMAQPVEEVVVAEVIEEPVSPLADAQRRLAEAKQKSSPRCVTQMGRLRLKVFLTMSLIRPLKGVAKLQKSPLMRRSMPILLELQSFLENRDLPHASGIGYGRL